VSCCESSIGKRLTWSLASRARTPRAAIRGLTAAAIERMNLPQLKTVSSSTQMNRKTRFMKTSLIALVTKTTLGLLAAGLALHLMAADAPKKLLVVTTTLGFRHSSIPTAEKVIAKLGAQSGAFAVEYARVDPNSPEFQNPDTKKTDNAKVKDAITKILAEKMTAESLKQYDGIIFANTTGDLPLPDKQAFLDWLKSGKAFVGMHSCSDTFHGWPAFLQMLGGEFAGHFSQVGVECVNQDTSHPATATLGPSLVIKQEEIYLIKNHDAKDCRELLLLEKLSNRGLPPKGYKPGQFAGAGEFDSSKTEQAGRFPVSWCKEYGKGKVFYTTLGHREDIWDDEWQEGNGKRTNPPEVAKAYQRHILGGIRWALGLESGSAKPKAD
jgi:uncharacterized protein